MRSPRSTASGIAILKECTYPFPCTSASTNNEPQARSDSISTFARWRMVVGPRLVVGEPGGARVGGASHGAVVHLRRADAGGPPRQRFLPGRVVHREQPLAPVGAQHGRVPHKRPHCQRTRSRVRGRGGRDCGPHCIQARAVDAHLHSNKIWDASQRTPAGVQCRTRRRFALQGKASSYRILQRDALRWMTGLLLLKELPQVLERATCNPPTPAETLGS